MAVAAPVEKLPKSEPDIGKLNAFTGCIATVVKYMQPRGSIGATLVPTVNMPLQEILKLATTLPLQNGAGFYKFTVADAGGTGEDVWMTKLGGDIPTQGPQDGGFPNMASTPNDQQTGGVPTGPNVQHLGRGYYYNAELGVLTTPWGTAANWSRGEALPQPPTSNNQPHLASVPPGATPWSWPGPGQQGQGSWGGNGWGSFPAIDTGESARVKQLEQQIADQNRQREMDTLRAELRRQAEDTQKQFSLLVEKLTARPSGPSESELRLQAELAETKRRQEETERRLQDERREDQRRVEMRDMEAKFQTTIRELGTSKQDPMLPMLMTLITQQQASAMEAVKAIQSATATGTAAAERSTQQLLSQLQSSIMSPIQLMSLLQSAKGDAAEGAKAVVEATKDAMQLQKDVFTQLLEVSGQGGQPWYASAIQGALDRAAQITAALAERSQNQQAQTQLQQQQLQQQQMRRQVPMRQNPVQQQMGGAPAPAGAIPAPVASNERPEGAAYEKDTDEFVLLDGRRFPQPYVQREGWKRVLGLPAATVAREIAEMKAATAAPAPSGMNGASTGASAPTADVIDIVPPAKKPARRKTKNGAPQTHEQIAAMIEAMSEAEPAEVFNKISHVGDKELFGDLLWPYVENLRATMPAPSDVAKYVLQARGQVQGFGGTVPIALALLDAGQIQVLVERLVPEAEPTYQDACVQAIGAALEAEDLGEEEEAEEVE
jgi:hypothetical protein